MVSKTNDAQWVERHPEQCPNGHTWITESGKTKAHAFLPGWESGLVAGHRTWTCTQCYGVIHAEVGASLLYKI